MSNDPLSNFPGSGGVPLAPPTPMRARRYALGMPAGSIRAILALSVLASLGLLVFLGKEELGEIKTLYVYLWFLLFLVLASFFAAHGKTIGVPQLHGKRSPLGLPSGSVRVLLILGLGGIVAWLYHTDHMFKEPLTLPRALPLVMPLGFLGGYLVAGMVRRTTRDNHEPAWFQDVAAWVALVAIFLLGFDVIYLLFINPSRPEENRASLTLLEGIMAGIISFYFGART